MRRALTFVLLLVLSLVAHAQSGIGGGNASNGSGGGSFSSGSATSIAQPSASSTTILQAVNNGANQSIRVGVKGDSFTVNSHPGGGAGDGPLVSTNRWAEQIRIKGQATWGSHGTGVFPLIANNAGGLNALGWSCTGTTDASNLSLGPFAGSTGSLLHMVTGAVCTFHDLRNLTFTNLSVYYATPSTTSSLVVVADGSTAMGTATSANSTQAGAVNGGLTARRFDSATTLPGTTHTIVYTCTGDCYLYANDGVNGTTGFSVDLEGISGAVAATFGASTTNQLAFDALIPGGEQAFIYMDQTNDASGSVSASTFSTQISNIVSYEQALSSAPTVMLAIPPVDVVNNTHPMAAYTQAQLAICASFNLTCVNIQNRGTSVGTTAVGWGSSYNAVSGLWDLTGTAGVHPNDAGNLDEFQMIYAQLFNPINTLNSITLEHVFSGAGSFNYAHGLNTPFYQSHCMARSGGVFAAAPSGTTDFSADVNDATVTVTGATDLICSFNASAAAITGSNIAAGLVEFWAMNDGSGTTFADGAGTANTETIQTGTLTWASNAGLPGTTATFSSTAYTHGANQTATNFTGAAPFSVSAWVNISNLNVIRTIASTLDPASSFVGWEFTLDYAGGAAHLEAFIDNTYLTNFINVDTSTGLTANTLHYVVMTYDGSKTAAGVQFYIDGVLAAKNAPQGDNLTATIVNTKPVALGGRVDGTDPINGVEAFVRIYNRALSSRDASAFFAAGAQ